MSNGARMKALLLAGAAMLAATGCAPRKAPVATGCLAEADRHAGADAIRSTPRAASEDPQLCEGLALLTERKAQPAIAALEAAAGRMAEADRWSAQGYLARALALDGQGERALQNWDEAIEGATRTGHVDRENIFRADRGVLFAQQKQYGPALADFEAVYRRAKQPKAKSEMAYMALKVSVSAGNLASVERWYPLAVRAAEAVGDATKIAYATQFYGQMLDERQDYDASAKLYQRGVDRIEATGSKYLHAEMLEFQGQSRFAAGDYRGGERAYAQAAEMFRQAGRADYAAFLEKNLKASTGRFEAGHACAALVEERRYDAAAAAVTDIPRERRSFGAKTCLVDALDGAGDTGRAQRELDDLLTSTEPGGWPCDELKALSRRVGHAPPIKSSVPGPPPAARPAPPQTCAEAIAQAEAYSSSASK